MMIQALLAGVNPADAGVCAAAIVVAGHDCASSLMRAVRVDR